MLIWERMAPAFPFLSSYIPVSAGDLLYVNAPPVQAPEMKHLPHGDEWAAPVIPPPGCDYPAWQQIQLFASPFHDARKLIVFHYGQVRKSIYLEKKVFIDKYPLIPEGDMPQPRPQV